MGFLFCKRLVYLSKGVKTQTYSAVDDPQLESTVQRCRRGQRRSLAWRRAGCRIQICHRCSTKDSPCHTWEHQRSARVPTAVEWRKQLSPFPPPFSFSNTYPLQTDGLDSCANILLGSLLSPSHAAGSTTTRCQNKRASDIRKHATCPAPCYLAASEATSPSRFRAGEFARG